MSEKKYCSRKCYYAYRASPEGIKARFWEYVSKSDGCWIFGGCIGHEGYGSFATGDTESGTRQQFQAHRFAWLDTNGAIPSDKLVLHKCDVRACVNPAHLYLGNRLDNSRDCISRGRFNKANTPIEKLLWPELSRRVKRLRHFAAGDCRQGEKNG